MRSHARRKQWAKVWQPKPGNQVEETPARKTLRQAAKAQAQQLGPTGLENLGKVIKKMKKKAPGPDGWTCQFLKDLDEAGVQGLMEQMIEWERQGRLPGQLCVTLVTMLAKNDKIERPIGLTHYAYRAWARARWPLCEKWAREFAQNTPWDKAKKGVSSLDVALARIIRHETARARKQCGVTLLLDIEAFYENIQHEKLISQGLQHQFPAVVLNGAMDLYQGPRYIEGEGVLSAPIRCTQGIIAGCPFAPGLSTLMIHPIIQPMWSKKGIRHIDVWLDDIGIDVEARNPLQAAKRGQEVFREVKTRLQGEGLTLSIKKTVFVVTDGKTRKAMSTIREKDEPEVRFQAKRPRSGYLWWRPQKTCHSQRQAKQGAKKENQIGPPSGGQTWGANQSVQRFHHVGRSVRTPSNGSSPKKDEMVQACHGRLAGTAVPRGD